MRVYRIIASELCDVCESRAQLEPIKVAFIIFGASWLNSRAEINVYLCSCS